jgi:predicted membrane GTPase involved in stress response
MLPTLTGSPTCWRSYLLDVLTKEEVTFADGHWMVVKSVLDLRLELGANDVDLCVALLRAQAVHGLGSQKMTHCLSSLISKVDSILLQPHQHTLHQILEQCSGLMVKSLRRRLDRLLAK